jgi:hypothetical protein
MTGKIKNARDLFLVKLEIYGQIQSLLENMLENRQGSQWGLEQLTAVEERFSVLKKIDKLEETIRTNSNGIMPDRKLINDLKVKMLRIKQLMSMLQIRLEGGKQIISYKLGKVLEGKRIIGYKNSGKIFSESNTCIC